jgi:hypothetical protein
MIDPWAYELTRSRQQELLARADRFRLGRIAKQAKRSKSSSSNHPALQPADKQYLMARI